MIMAHKNLEQLCRLIEYFRVKCDVFIHLDRKCALAKDAIDRLYSYRQVKLVSADYEVNWGGTSVLESEMALLRSAFEFGKYEYFHLLSGQDYPVKPLGCFLDFFEKNAGKEFLQCVSIPNERWEKNTYRRFQYFYPYDWAQGQDNPRAWVREQVEIQVKKGIKRPIPDEFDTLYGSSQWFSITQDAARVLLDYTREYPAFYNRMWMTFAPEECYVASVLLNKMDRRNIVSSNCRFILWRYENGNRPANLGMEHFHYLLEERFLFARKMEYPCSVELLDWIDHYLLCDHRIRSLKNGVWHYNGYLAYECDGRFCEYVARFCADMSISTAVDMGCGSGWYVAKWRKRGLSFAGYDGNPYTKELSKRLLPKGDEPCGVVDLLEDIGGADNFELVVCKDVLPYIPKDKLRDVVANLANISSAYILLGWNVPDNLAYIAHNDIDVTNLVSLFEKQGFKLEKSQTSRICVTLNSKKYGVFVCTDV